MMNRRTFAEELRKALPQGMVLENPGGGTTTIEWCDGERLCYRRGGSLFYVDLSDLHDAYEHFLGKDVTTTDLKAFRPEVFDSDRGGHNCHCTVLFLTLREIGVRGDLWGRGRRGAPFGVTLAKSSTRPR